jgi:TrmH family RNA methyltransferase
MISSTTNPRVKRVCKLQAQAKARDEERVFVIEGAKLFLEAPEHLIQEVYITQDYLCKVDISPQIAEKLAALPYETVSEEVMRKMSDTKTPQGILCVVAMEDKKCLDWGWEFPAAKEGSPIPLILLLEDIRDPGNLGTIFRAAEAAGVTALYLNQGCADCFNPKAVRASMGSLFRVPFAYEDLSATIKALERQGIGIYAACPAGKGEAKAYDSYDYRKGAAFLIGNESQGLREESQTAARIVSIPMAVKVESLNAATAAAILLYEAVRQRRKT